MLSILVPFKEVLSPSKKSLWEATHRNNDEAMSQNTTKTISEEMLQGQLKKKQNMHTQEKNLASFLIIYIQKVLVTLFIRLDLK